MKTFLVACWLLQIGALAVASESSSSRKLSLENETCPWWFIWNNSQTDCHYECGSDVKGSVVNNSVREVQLRGGFCMTSNTHGNAMVAAPCLYTEAGSFCLIQLSCTNIHNCSQYNRQSQLCSQCLPDFAPAVYSYDMRCVNCSEYKYNWLKYVGIAFLPLTGFYIIITVFHITLTSPSINAFILICQVLSSPLTLRPYFIKPFSFNGYRLIAAFCGVWNLDFFRTLHPPFCLHPNVSILHVLALDYIVAVYPLLLILLTYFLVKLHDRGCVIIRYIWKPFHFCLFRCQRYWGMKFSLVDAFATFILLSYCKFLFTSLDILSAVKVYNINGDFNIYVSMNASIDYFGPKHLPFALLAIAVLFVFIFIPTVLLVLYPCHCFQKILNNCHLRSQVLHAFTDAFQGYFKDGTNGTRDCRYFAALYLLTRVALFSLVFFPINIQLLLGIIVGLFMVALLASIQPYKSPADNVINILASFVLMFNALLCMVFFIAHCSFPYYAVFFKQLIYFCFALIPIIYIGFFVHKSFKISQSLVFLKSCCQIIISSFCKEQEPESENEASVLLPHHPPDN